MGKEEETYIVDLGKRKPTKLEAIVMLCFIMFGVVYMCYVIYTQAERIGYYHSCKDVGLNYTYLEGVRGCYNLTAINKERIGVITEERKQQLEKMEEETREIIRKLQEAQSK
jgi:hypothetical protein